MRVYEDYKVLDEWAVTYTLELNDDDGKFYYYEYWGSYAGGSTRKADGRWWRSGATVFLHTERADQDISLDLVPGRDRVAVEDGDLLKFSEDSTYRLQKQSAGNLQQPPPEGDLLTTQAFHNVPPAPASYRRELSSKLAALIRLWIDALPAEGLQNRIARLGRKFDFLPLHTTEIYVWALTSDGVVVWMDHETFDDTPEPVTDPLMIYATLVHGARSHRELAELIPSCPAGARQCDVCGGMGWHKSPGGAAESHCFRCRGFGWQQSAALI